MSTTAERGAPSSAANGSRSNGAGTDERDRRLMHRAVDGDQEAFRGLYDQYADRLFNFCLRLSRNRDDAAEACQEAFFAVFKKLPEMDIDQVVFSAYLFASARYTTLRMIRKKQRVIPTENVPEGQGPVEVFTDPERRTLYRDQQQAMAVANAKLPERHRAVLVLRELEGMSYVQIAGILGMNENSVAQLLSRARLRLRDEFRMEQISRPQATRECERALPMLSRQVDGELKPAEQRWLKDHMSHCKDCRLNLEGVQEAGATYRSWLPVPLAMGLFERLGEVASGNAAISGSGAASGSGADGSGSQNGEAADTVEMDAPARRGSRRSRRRGRDRGDRGEFQPRTLRGRSLWKRGAQIGAISILLGTLIVTNLGDPRTPSTSPGEVVDRTGGGLFIGESPMAGSDGSGATRSRGKSSSGAGDSALPDSTMTMSKLMQPVAPMMSPGSSKDLMLDRDEESSSSIEEESETVVSEDDTTTEPDTSPSEPDETSGTTDPVTPDTGTDDTAPVTPPSPGDDEDSKMDDIGSTEEPTSDPPTSMLPPWCTAPDTPGC